MNEFEALQEFLPSNHGTYVHGFEEVADVGMAWRVDGVEGDFKTVAEIEGEQGRWSRSIEVVVQAPSGRHYRYEYSRGLTEYQDNYYDGGLVEVLPHVQTVTIVEYKAVAA